MHNDGINNEKVLDGKAPNQKGLFVPRLFQLFITQNYPACNPPANWISPLYRAPGT
jgi:hypothetical protein